METTVCKLEKTIGAGGGGGGGLFKDCKYLQECLLVDEKVSVLNFIHT